MPKLTSANIKQDAPFALQVELTEGCNLRCSTCGLNAIRGKANDLKFLTMANATKLCERILEAGWNPRIEFAMHGEPSLHPQLTQVLSLFRKLLPKLHLMMTSNGGGFMKDPTVSIDEAMESLNVLALDAYEGVAIVPSILKRYQGIHDPIQYPADPRGNPHRRRKPDQHDLVIVQDIVKATKGTHSSLNNHAGSGMPANTNGHGKRCAKPFRELSIRYDGNVAICCNDWKGEYYCGNVFDQPLEEVWQGPAFVAARKALYNGLRDFTPCVKCDAVSYRPGLLPDHKGLQQLALPNKEDRVVMAKAVAGKPLATPVLRQWELPQV